MAKAASSSLLLRLAGILLLAYVLCSGWVLFQAMGNGPRDSVAALQQGEDLLATNPAAAAAAFRRSEQAAGTSLARLRAVPWYIRLLTWLPPFRWQVHLVKASHDLAAAGETTASLRASYPAISLGSGNGDLGSLLGVASSRYFSWFDQHTNQIGDLSGSLDQAQAELGHVPAWSMLSQRGAFLTLRGKLSRTQDELSTAINLSAAGETALGAHDQADHAMLILFPGLGQQLKIIGHGGAVTSATFSPDGAQLGQAYHDALTLQGFWNDAASTIRPDGVEVLGVVDSSVIADLLGQTGKLTLPGVENRTVSADTLAANPPPLGDLSTAMLAALSSRPGSLGGLYSQAGDAFRTKAIQLRAEGQLQAVLGKLVPLDRPPDAPNWLKVMPAASGTHPSIHLERLAVPWKRQLVEHLTVSLTHGSDLAVYLPASAKVLDAGVQTTAGNGYQKVALSGGATSYKLTYALPLSWTALTTFTLLANQNDPASFSGFRYAGPAATNLALGQ